MAESSKGFESSSIVLIDDDRAVREAISCLLRTYGFQVSDFDCAEAFLNATEVRPNCLIVDLNMPGISGIELVRRIRQQGDKYPILVVSGFVDGNAMSAISAHDNTEILIKPFQPVDMIEVVLRMLENESGSNGLDIE